MIIHPRYHGSARRSGGTTRTLMIRRPGRKAVLSNLGLLPRPQGQVRPKRLDLRFITPVLETPHTRGRATIRKRSKNSILLVPAGM